MRPKTLYANVWYMNPIWYHWTGNPGWFVRSSFLEACGTEIFCKTTAAFALTSTSVILAETYNPFTCGGMSSFHRGNRFERGDSRCTSGNAKKKNHMRGMWKVPNSAARNLNPKKGFGQNEGMRNQSKKLRPSMYYQYLFLSLASKVYMPSIARSPASFGFYFIALLDESARWL